MMSMSRISVVLDEMGRGVVKIDGKPVRARSLTIQAGVDQSTRVIIDLDAAVDVDAFADVEVRGSVKATDHRTTDPATDH
jgi:hypothetical protein